MFIARMPIVHSHKPHPGENRVSLIVWLRGVWLFARSCCDQEWLESVRRESLGGYDDDLDKTEKLKFGARAMQNCDIVFLDEADASW